MSVVGQNIARLRVEKRLTQAQLAQLANTTVNQVCRIETGDIASPRNLEAFAEALEVSSSELTNGIEVLPSYTGNQLKDRRLSLGWSIKKLADQVGVSTSVINKMESEDAPSTKFLKQILEALDLLGGEREITDSQIEGLTLSMRDCVNEAVLATRFVLNSFGEYTLDLNDQKTLDIFSKYLEFSFYSKHTGDYQKFMPRSEAEQKNTHK